ncbi:MAG TPA: hypothetical protein VHE30_22410 [Polyangiaceae bacterium]|nr:hypothetical protein [Polyangiaceae bacterium]
MTALDARKARAVASLPAAEVARLERTAQSFFDARVADEIDRSRPERVAVEARERATLDDAYVSALEQVRNPSFPPGDQDPKTAESELDRVFLRLMNCSNVPETEGATSGAISRANIRNTERLWREYRDAWAELGVAVRSDGGSGRWRAWAARERTRMLAGLADGRCP